MAGLDSRARCRWADCRKRLDMLCGKGGGGWRAGRGGKGENGRSKRWNCRLPYNGEGCWFFFSGQMQVRWRVDVQVVWRPKMRYQSQRRQVAGGRRRVDKLDDASFASYALSRRGTCRVSFYYYCTSIKQTIRIYAVYCVAITRYYKKQQQMG